MAFNLYLTQLSPSPGVDAGFGSGFAISRNAAVMAVGETGVGATYISGVYIYDWISAGWVQRGGKLIGSTIYMGERFGASIALNATGTIMVVGAPRESLGATQQGAVFTYDWNGSDWVERSQILTPPGSGTDYYGYGQCVALSSDGSVLAVGAPSPAKIYIYDWSGSAWVQRSVVLNNTSYGYAVALNAAGNVLIIGQPAYAGVYANQGMVTVFDWSGSAWIMRNTYNAPSNNVNNRFGASVGCDNSGDKICIGAGNQAGANNGCGVVYTYNRSGSNFVLDQTVTLASPINDDAFGAVSSLSGDGTKLAITSPGRDASNTNQGAVYFYSSAEYLQSDFPLSLAILRTIDSLWSFPLDLDVTASITPQWTLSLQVLTTTVQPSWPLSLGVSGQVTPQWGMSLAVLSPSAMMASTAYAWSTLASIGGSDVSGRLIGPVKVSAEANSAAIATFSIRPTSGAFTPASYPGAAVALDYVWSGAGQSQRIGLFLGQVDSIDIDPATFIATLTCSDRRRGLLYGSDAAALATLLPGSLWSDAVFSADADGYQMAEDRISTLCADFDLLPDGSPALTGWAAKTTPDWTFSQSACLADSLGLVIGSSASLVQQVVATFDYRFSRLRRRDALMSYHWTQTNLRNYSIGPPSLSLITEALDKTGWDIGTPNVARPRKWYLDSGTYFIVDAANGVAELGATMSKRFAQSIDEHVTLTVACAASGCDVRLNATLSGALACAFDASAWEASSTALPVLAAPGGSIEMVLDATSDAATGRAAANLAITALLAMARRTILGSHRQHRVTFSTPLNPLINRTHTISLSAQGITAKGKVHQVEHTLDRDSGRAISVITLAISQPSLPVPGADSAMTPPAASSAPTLAQSVLDAHRLNLTDVVGGLPSSAVYSDALQGYLCNIPSEFSVANMVTNWGTASMEASGEIYGNGSGQPYAVNSFITPASNYSGAIINPLFQPDKAYPWQFRIIPPPIEPSARDNLTIEQAATYLVRVPADTFTITIP